MDEQIKKEYIDLVVERMVARKIILENSKYGQFIIQTNEVQFYLIFLILLRSYVRNKKLRDYLERLELGNLIDCFRICIKDSAELKLADSLKKYNKFRNALAHKMFTDKKLTIKECELAIKLGKELLSELKRLFDLGARSN